VRPVYLDHAATTPVRPEAAEAMVPWLTTRFGNPSGGHAVARAARQAVEQAREVVAGALGCEPGELVFTSGGTESDNLAIRGAVGAVGAGGARAVAVCTATEHHAVLHTVEALGGRVVPVGPDGVIDLDGLADALHGQVAVVSVMLANNEVGTVQPLSEVAAIVAARAPRALLHTDAVQAVAWLDVARLVAPAGLISIAAHKFGGPQGVGALVVRDGARITAQQLGGGQERDRRSGTHNVAGVVGMAAALEKVLAERAATVSRVRGYRDDMAARLLATVDGVVETGGPPEARLPNLLHLRFKGIDNEELLVLLDDAGVCASAGSACASGALEPSHVLTAMGVAPEDARGSLRLSLGWTTTAGDIERALDVVATSVARLRS